MVYTRIRGITYTYILSLYENALRERDREREREREKCPLWSFSVSLKFAVNICFIMELQNKRERKRN